MDTGRIRLCLLLVLTGLLGGLLPGAPAEAQPATRRPNVLLVLTDDQGWGDIHSHGNAQIDTPQMDRLAGDGARFERFLVSPLCAPTRAALLTGRDHIRTGVTWVTHRQEVMRSDEVTLAEILRDAGYATGCFGKWHNGPQFPHTPKGQGFDEFFGFLGGGLHMYFDAVLQHNGREVETRGFITDVITDAALEFIRRQRERPFFCYLPYNAPHSPFQVPDRYFDKYRARGLGDQDAAVYGMVENLDDNLGRLRQCLQELGLVESTIVVFLTDNGPNGRRFNGHMRGTKGSVHEGGVRVPCFVCWPGQIRAGLEIQPLAAHVDLLPTLADLCGVPLEASNLPLSGSSLKPLLLEQGGDWPERVLYTINSRDPAQMFPGALRTPQYRLVRDRRAWELYDMLADPEQSQDVADQHPELVRELSARYERWFAEASRRCQQRPPIPVGWAEADRVQIIAPEGNLVGDLAFSNGPGWTTDWMTGWDSTDESIWWDLDVTRPGIYRVQLEYACPESSVGTQLELSASGGSTLHAVIRRAFDTGLLLRPERTTDAPRWMREFVTSDVGQIQLPAGSVQLTLKATEMPGQSVCELRGLVLERVGDGEAR
jgi:arylsulfatase A